MPNLHSVSFTGTVLFLTIVVASMVSCVNIEDQFVKKFFVLENLVEGQTRDVLQARFPNPVTMNNANLIVNGRIGDQESAFPDSVRWDFRFFDSEANVIREDSITTEVNSETGKFREEIISNAFTVPAGGIVGVKATTIGSGQIDAGTWVKVRCRMIPLNLD
ncbi:MAG: hypothetical protein L0Y39_12735 [Methylococcaceae bacterium]|nr:hypothetical protein [Methylococcaceae bacterium]